MSFKIKKELRAAQQDLFNIYQEINSVTQAARILCDKKGWEFNDSVRRLASVIINDMKLEEGDTEFGNTTTTETKQYKTPKVKFSPAIDIPSAWCSTLNKFLTIEEYCERYGLDINSVKSSKLVTHNATHMTYNIAFFTSEEESINNIQDDLEGLIKKHIKPTQWVSLVNQAPDADEWFDRVVYSDAHIGMNVNGEGDPMYDGKWDKEELEKRKDIMIGHIIKYQKSRTLYIDDLGDYLDGLQGLTTRGGHKLPQNMNDKEVFDLGVSFKVSLVDSLVHYYDNIICNNITNDNHSGVFAYFVNSAVKEILDIKYNGVVTTNIIKRFMGHYSDGVHTFVIAHGKDSKENRYGFKPQLDTKQSEKIDQYCKAHNLYNGNHIEFSKGDSHQAIYDDTTSNDFQYYNYPAFSPPSNWVKTNFKDTKSGFRMYNISRTENIKITIPYFFN